VPVAGTGGAAAVTPHAALNVETGPDGRTLGVTIAAVRPLPRATLRVETAGERPRDLPAVLDPARPFKTTLTVSGTAGLRIRLLDASARVLLDYQHPEPGAHRSEYTPFTRGLEDPPKPQDKMTAEELTLAAEKRLKQLSSVEAAGLLEKALALDPGYSRAHLLLGIDLYTAGRPDQAAPHLEKALARDPYSAEAAYYLAMCLLAQGQPARAERHLYYVWPDSALFGAREYQLGRLALLAGDKAAAAGHLERSIAADAQDTSARLLLALLFRASGRRAEATAQLDAVASLDPANPVAQAERHFLDSAPQSRSELVRLLGGQTQEALSAAEFYRDAARWREAVQVLQLAASAGKDHWGTPPEFYYVLAWCQRQAGDAAAAAASLAKARAASGKVDRFPCRPSSLAPLEEAVAAGPRDTAAQHALACLLYSLGRKQEAVSHWEAAVEAAPADFSTRRSLGLAYAELEMGPDKAAAQLERAVALSPAHTPTFNDLSTLYAASGRFEEQVRLLEKALAAKPGDDALAESLLMALLHSGRYPEAGRIVETHAFTPRHRSYGLRDTYRLMRSAAAARAFQRGDFPAALGLLDSALHPPVSLGMDDFEDQVSPRLDYWRGRVLEASGRQADAHAAYEHALSGLTTLSGDRDSWSSENFSMTLALRRLGRAPEAAVLEEKFEEFALSEIGDHDTRRRAEANYLLGLVRKHGGKPAEAKALFENALKARPDFLAARLELRGESLDPLSP
jgi:tetratricopeptide (TPR) repeat protein